MKISNKYIIQFVLLNLLLVLSLNIVAQEHHLKVVKIKSKRIERKSNDERLNNFSTGMQTKILDSQWMEQYRIKGLQQLLSEQIPVFVKSYGINGMASLHFRGASAAQTQVLWNGVPLNNGNSGITDIATFGVSNFDQISILYGGSGALLGSGNVGAALMLENRFPPIDSIKKWTHQFAFELGSFGQLKWNIHEQFQKRKMSFSFRYLFQSANNNFDYKDENGENKKMANAQLLSNGLMMNLTYRLSKKTTFHLNTWVQDYNREIPPALFEKYSVKNQQDQSIRIAFSAQHQINKQSILYSKSAFLQDKLVYNDDAVLIHSSNLCQQIYQEIGWKKSFPQKQELIIFNPITIAWTNPNNDSVTRFQNKIALAAAYSKKWMNEKLTTAINTRLERINELNVLLAGSNLSYRFGQLIKIRTNIQNTFRAPTLNELYYLPGGNLQLKPEKGINLDGGYELLLPINSGILLKHELSIFTRTVNDWILWFGGSIWTPHNIAQVYSRGIETQNSLYFQLEKWKIFATLNTSFLRSTTQKSVIANDGSIGKQIPYSPRYNIQSNIGFEYQTWRLSYNHNYTGYRFVNTDESQFVLPYNLGNLYLQKTFLIKKREALKLNFSIQNIWNYEYQIVMGRPMPMRNYSMGITINF